MSVGAASTRSPLKQNSTAAVRTFWKSAQSFASAAKLVVRLPRNALLEGGVLSHAKATDATQLAAELAELGEEIGKIMARLTKGGAPLISRSERDLAGKQMDKLVRDGALIDAATLMDGLKFSRQALSKALKANRIFYVEVGGKRHFPGFFLDTRLHRRQLEEVSKALGELPGASKLQFFMSKKASLSGKTPLDALGDGQYASVRVAAEGFAER